MILIRYNKLRGQRGSLAHAWRVFDGDKEYLAKHVRINVPSWDVCTGPDYNIGCEGVLSIDRETSTITVN